MQSLFDQVCSETSGDMDPEAFRHYGHLIVDWIAGYLSDIRSYPVLSQSTPGSICQALPRQAPVQPEAMETILADFGRVLLPGITHWNSAGFMGYFGLTGSGPSILAEMLDASLNVTRMLWRTSPAATELEQVTLDWLRQMLGLPEPLFGMLHHNSAILTALAAAREALNLQIRQRGMAGRREVARLRVYASQEAHSSVEKAMIALGLGLEGLCKIKTDQEFRLDVEALEEAINEDLARGWRPCAVVATVGTTSTTSIDPVPQIAALCQRYKLWLHVDAAYAGVAAIVPSKRWVLAGCEQADSLTVNPHKWLFTSFGCSVLFTRRPEIVKETFSLTPAYLQNADRAPDLMDYDLFLPHRIPALKLWMVMRYFGQEGLAARIEEHCRLARLLALWVDNTPDMERLAPVNLSVVCFRIHPPGIDDELTLELLNERVMNRVNAAGHFFLSHSKIRGKFILRIAIGNIRTTERDVRGIWEAILAARQAEVCLLRTNRAGNQFGIKRKINLP
ncbi:aminotransferase class V-fold PLP-dependent enzyme [Ktedonosporobacter rubrisoli]|uniref:Aminotransferase class V-fold PLP-dependent enzyme n=1 Tax=Ktedonosporobacter rubrisoli TaxID=2509675 RepID=A0A4P6JXL7_KTERU|nr:aminotransferase class I/II-fold pyridoxal phosphate-dependent enzyme [Ktedonosporobacter rubrisoli]QBD80163.1 aminotransferase class V-fold PLP-dependent enzyme [Ktedonosporobacter rubrisoli]